MYKMQLPNKSPISGITVAFLFLLVCAQQLQVSQAAAESQGQRRVKRFAIAAVLNPNAIVNGNGVVLFPGPRRSAAAASNVARYASSASFLVPYRVRSNQMQLPFAARTAVEVEPALISKRSASLGEPQAVYRDSDTSVVPSDTREHRAQQHLVQLSSLVPADGRVQVGKLRTLDSYDRPMLMSPLLRLQFGSKKLTAVSSAVADPPQHQSLAAEAAASAAAAVSSEVERRRSEMQHQLQESLSRRSLNYDASPAVASPSSQPLHNPVDFRSGAVGEQFASSHYRPENVDAARKLNSLNYDDRLSVVFGGSVATSPSIETTNNKPGTIERRYSQFAPAIEASSSSSSSRQTNREDDSIAAGASVTADNNDYSSAPSPAGTYSDLADKPSTTDGTVYDPRDYRSAVDRSSYQGGGGSAGGYQGGGGSANGYQSSGSANGYQSSGSANGYQSSGSANGYQSSGSANGYQSSGSANGYQGGSGRSESVAYQNGGYQKQRAARPQYQQDSYNSQQQPRDYPPTRASNSVNNNVDDEGSGSPQSSNQQQAGNDQGSTEVAAKTPDRLALLLQRSQFTCAGKKDGYYADNSVQCQAFHYCVSGVKHSWQCPEGTVFHQVHLNCVPNSQDICDQTERYHHMVNEYLYKPMDQNGPNQTTRYHQRYYPEEFTFGMPTSASASSSTHGDDDAGTDYPQQSQPLHHQSALNRQHMASAEPAYTGGSSGSTGAEYAAHNPVSYGGYRQSASSYASSSSRAGYPSASASGARQPSAAASYPQPQPSPSAGSGYEPPSAASAYGDADADYRGVSTSNMYPSPAADSAEASAASTDPSAQQPPTYTSQVGGGVTRYAPQSTQSRHSSDITSPYSPYLSLAPPLVPVPPQSREQSQQPQAHGAHSLEYQRAMSPIRGVARQIADASQRQRLQALIYGLPSGHNHNQQQKHSESGVPLYVSNGASSLPPAAPSVLKRREALHGYANSATTVGTTSGGAKYLRPAATLSLAEDRHNLIRDALGLQLAASSTQDVQIQAPLRLSAADVNSTTTTSAAAVNNIYSEQKQAGTPIEQQYQAPSNKKPVPIIPITNKPTTTVAESNAKSVESLASSITKILNISSLIGTSKHRN